MHLRDRFTTTSISYTYWCIRVLRLLLNVFSAKDFKDLSLAAPTAVIGSGFFCWKSRERFAQHSNVNDKCAKEKQHVRRRGSEGLQGSVANERLCARWRNGNNTRPAATTFGRGWKNNKKGWKKGKTGATNNGWRVKGKTIKSESD